MGPRATFPLVPQGWYHVCAASDLLDKPVGLEVGERKYVAFRGAGSPAGVPFAFHAKPVNGAGPEMKRQMRANTLVVHSV